MSKILVVDDEPLILRSCRRMLETKKYEVATASDVSQAKLKLKEGKFDLVVTDMRLPGETGLDLLTEVTKNHEYTGVIVMTGYADIKNVVDCMRQGAFDYISKPFEMDEFLRVVERFFENRNLKKEVVELKDIVGLYKIALAITRLMPLDELLQLILNTTEEQIQADGGSIALWDEESRELVVRVATGHQKEEAAGSRLKLGQRVCGYAILKREPVILHGALNKDARFKNEKVFNGTKSGMSIPMYLEDKLIGALNLKRTESDVEFSEYDLKRAFILAEMAALAISNSQVFSKMKELDELKSHFISTVSHELRTPITSIKASADLMSKTKVDKKQEKLLELTKRNVSRMMRLVQDLLDFSRMEKGTISIIKKRVDFSGIISDSIEAVSHKAKEKGITFDLRVKEIPQILCDPHRIGQVLNNLLDNSIKYSPKNTNIEVVVKKAADYLQCSVTDEGEGILPENREKIFERFYQVNRSLNRATGGFGLGLSIVRQIIELHGGEIFVESPPEGKKKGTRFTVKLPIK